MVESVSMVESVDLSWGHFLPKESLALLVMVACLQVGVAKVKDAKEHIQ